MLNSVHLGCFEAYFSRLSLVRLFDSVAISAEPIFISFDLIRLYSSINQFCFLLMTGLLLVVNFVYL